MSLQTFPVELLLKIGSELDNTKDMNSLVLSCRHMNRIFNDLLYAHAVTHSLPKAVYWVGKHGQMDTLKRLLDHGADLIHNPETTPLFAGARHGQTEVVEFLIAKGIDLEMQSGINRTALIEASNNGQQEIVRLLVKSGANADGPAGYHMMTPLFAAAQTGHTDLVLFFIGQGANPTHRVCGCPGALIYAIDGRCPMDIINMLLKETHPEQLDKSDDWNRTCLEMAAAVGDTAIAQALIDAGAGVTCHDLIIPLRIAVMAGHEEMVGFLLDAGACPNTDYDQYSPLGWAVESGNAKIVRLLLERGADPEAEDPRQGSLLGPPIRGGAYTIVELLLDAGLTPDPAVLSDYESPPLVTALRCCQDDVAFLLIERGANLNPGGDPHVSTLAWAVRNGNLRLLEYMLEKGADVDAGVEGGETPLMVAAMNGRAEFIKPLLDGGASFSLTNSQGQTALGIAVQRGWFDVAAAILDINFRTGLGFDTPEESGLFIVNDANTQTIIDKPDILGRTPLFHATVSGRQDLVALLLTHGSTAINTSTCAERSPWLVAQQWVDRNTWDIPDTQCNTIRDLFADVQEPAAVLARGPMIQMAALDPAKLKYPDAPRLDLPCSYPDAARLDLWPHVNPWRRCNLCKTRLGKRGEHFVWDSYRRVGFQVCLECMIKRRGKVCLIW